MDGAATPFPDIQIDILDRLTRETNQRIRQRTFPVSVKLKGKTRWLCFAHWLRAANVNRASATQSARKF